MKPRGNLPKAATSTTPSLSQSMGSPSRSKPSNPNGFMYASYWRWRLSSSEPDRNPLSWPVPNLLRAALRYISAAAWTRPLRARKKRNIVMVSLGPSVPANALRNFSHSRRSPSLNDNCASHMSSRSSSPLCLNDAQLGAGNAEEGSK
eukprot:CAMPEP_0170254830 /NCGR_PEP_ID=MMETSP0116_2-20130129/27267_1 /TAXON_ID=400756 /ORGANISM="Durinskia baltica, Strain CSIRO CS-38" /LENGTH=147 /DNA_ID=CAMNT_0010505837 /DNA_START=510 /DNA_END=953 /DNA_ORIENTATION=-